MGFNLFKYELKVVDEKSLDPQSLDGIISTGCLVFVYDAGTKTLSTLYSNETLTSKANPITRAQFATDAGIVFYSAASSHDLFVAHSDGSVSRIASVTPTMHTVKLNRDGVNKCVVFPMVFNSGGTETDTGIDLPKNVIVKDVQLEVVTTDATETVAIGLLSSETAGDADGLMVATSVANAGFFGLVATTVGSNETYISAARAGALMGLGSVGTDVANDFGQPGGSGHVVTGSNAVSITYTPSSSDTFAGYGYVHFKHLR